MVHTLKYPAAIAAAFISILLLVATGAASAVSVDSPQAPTDDPERVINTTLDAWTMDDTFLYWSDQCEVIPLSQNETAADSFLKRRSISGGVERTLNTDPSCFIHEPLAADDSGVYYANAAGKIMRHTPNDPETAVEAAASAGGGVDKIELDDDFIYWIRSSDKIFRAPKSGGAPVTLVDLPTSIVDFIVDRGQIYAAGFGGGIYMSSATCGSPPCAAEKISNTKASLLHTAGPNTFAGEFLAVSRDTQQLRGHSCLPSGSDWLCSSTLIHDGLPDWTIGGVDAICISKFGQFCNGFTHYFLTEVKDVGTGSRVVRVNKGTSDEIGIGDKFLDGIALDNGYVYYAEQAAGKSGIYRLPFNATSITRDLQAAAWEVTQSIQNLDNDVGLVAGKPTFVVVHGGQLLGPRAMSVEAELHGSRGGNPLPDSPLRARTGATNLRTGQILVRDRLSSNWLFVLPSSWYGQGTLHLKAVVDGRETYSDSDRNNNELEDDFKFSEETDACLFFSPVRTHAGTPSHQDPNFWPTIRRYETLSPIAHADALWMGEPIEEAEICWSRIGIPYPCWGPYELDQGWTITNFPPDRDRVLAKLLLRQALARVASITQCDFFVDAPVHSVGMVHPESETDDVGGYAIPYLNASWTRFPKHDDTPSSPRYGWPHEGGVLAQELGHNIGRAHVDCGGPDEFIDDDYPYDPCTLDDGDQFDFDTHFGFDPLSWEPIPPDEAVDYMSYSSPYWVSDYTYDAVRDHFILPLIQRQAARNELAAAESIVYISGFYEPTEDVGGLNYAYELAADNLDVGRLNQFIAPSNLSGDQPVDGGDDPIVGQLLLKNAAGNILDNRSVELLTSDDHRANDADSHFFAAAFPPPNGTVARVELVVGGKVVAESTPGVNAPQVKLLEPTAGANLDQTIRIRWQSSDPDGDTLLHTVSYSPDAGQTWITLVGDYPGLPDTAEVTLELQNPNVVPGSNGKAQVKVAASDGFNTTEAVSSLFSVAGRKPSAAISSPLPEQTFDAGEALVLQGAAYDAEEGNLPGTALSWNIDGSKDVGTGETVIVEGLAPQIGFVRLTATDNNGQSNSTTADLHILPLGVPTSTAPKLDGRCDDSAYAKATVLGLAPYDGGGQAFAKLVRTDTDLFVCLSGLDRGATNAIGTAGLYLDGDFSRGGEPTGDDQAFLVGEDGTPQRLVPGGANWTAADLTGYEGQMSADSETIWQAELRIPEALIANWDGRVGLAPIHENVSSGSPTFGWPFAANPNSNGTWAQALLGNHPRLDNVAPQSATVGDSQLVLTLDGRNFAADAVAIWDADVDLTTIARAGITLPTTVVSPTRLTATVSGNLLNVAGKFPVGVVNPELADFPSEARSVIVANPQPQLTSLAPAKVDAGNGKFDLTVKGSGFVPGATVLWDGEVRSTAFISAGELRASISAADVAQGAQIGITVLNPDPQAGQSSALFFDIEPQEGDTKFIFMPAVVGS